MRFILFNLFCRLFLGWFSFHECFVLLRRLMLSTLSLKNKQRDKMKMCYDLGPLVVVNLSSKPIKTKVLACYSDCYCHCLRSFITDAMHKIKTTGWNWWMIFNLTNYKRLTETVSGNRNKHTKMYKNVKMTNFIK